MTHPIDLPHVSNHPGEFALGVDPGKMADQLEALAAGLRDGTILHRSVVSLTDAQNDEFTWHELRVGYFKRVDPPAEGG